MKRFVSTLLVVVLTICLTGCAAAEEEKVLNIYTWEGYFSDEVLAGFTADTGIRINFTPFATNDEMLLKLQMGQGADYDIILASDVVLSLARKQNLLLPLDKSKLSNYENLNPEYCNQYYDPDGAYSVAFAAGSPAIVYDPEKVEGEITSFADLWDEQFADALCMVDDARVMIGETLKMLGYSYNTTDVAQLEEAAQKLAALKPNIRALDYNAPYQYVLSGEVKAAYMFTSQAVVCQQENPSLKVVFPSEGIGFGIDAIVIPADARHPDNAHKFINYILDADIAAKHAAWTMYLNPNKAAEPLIDPSVLAYDALNIPEELLAGKEFAEDIDAESESLYQKLWEDFKLL